jgi:ABC-type transport system involved in cytochrome c biogenesis permease subunit
LRIRSALEKVRPVSLSVEGGPQDNGVLLKGLDQAGKRALAEAMLNFDNSQRVLALDADEVQIGRRIYRSGESEYLINRVPARLKDIRDLFLGSGAGNSAYSIIEQGRVDQLLQATNIARRSVFEEAAGISRYKARKVDAQRKLERVAQNLLRLTDIVSEVETQLNAVRTQAAKAAKFREHTQELRTLRIGATADDYRVLSARLEAIDRQRHELSAEFDRAAENMAGNAAFIAMAGPARALNTLGGQVAWQASAFGAILALRQFVDDPVKRATWSAVAAVIAYADVPIVYFSVKWWNSLHQTQSSPETVSRAFHWPLRINAFGMLFLMTGLISLRARLAALRREEESAGPLPAAVPRAAAAAEGAR